MAARPKQYCTFYLNGLLFGVEVTKVQEVIRHHDMTRVPLAPNVIRGLINLRGQIVTAIDLRRRLNMPGREVSDRTINVVVRTDDGVVALIVDEISEVLEPDAELYEDPPDTTPPAVRSLIGQVCKLDTRLLLLLDVGKAVDIVAGGWDELAENRKEAN